MHESQLNSRQVGIGIGGHEAMFKRKLEQFLNN